MECDYFANAISLAARGVGVAFVDPLSAEDLAANAVAIRPFEPRIAYDFAVLHRRDRPMSKLAQAFAQSFDDRLVSKGVL